MEDAHVFIDGFAETEGSAGTPSAFFGVYDGHGGRSIVEFVEKYFHVNLEKELVDTKASTDEEVENAIKTAFLLTDIQSSKANLQVSGSTAATVLLRCDPATGKKRVHAANCGDARAVLSRKDGNAFRLSYDHKASDEPEKARIEGAGGFVLRGRVLGILAVARSFGDHSLKQFVVPTPFIQTVELVPDEDEYLILACDGVWDVMEDQEVVDFVRAEVAKSAGDAASFDNIARALVDEALKRGSTDNITAMVCRL
jgi:serine/threonine protein phosphatase PrpC